MATGAELGYNTSATALQIANTMFGNGATVVSASDSGPASSLAVCSNGGLAPGAVPGESGVILSTGNVRDFTQSSGDPNRTTNTTTDANNTALFNAVAGTSIYDAVWLDTDFIPEGNMMTMNFVFSSGEYPEYVDSDFNDVIGVWVNRERDGFTLTLTIPVNANVTNLQHRILVRDSLAKLLFRESEDLLAAKALVNDHSVRRATGGDVAQERAA
jgi:hypothetical protein